MGYCETCLLKHSRNALFLNHKVSAVILTSIIIIIVYHANDACTNKITLLITIMLCSVYRVRQKKSPWKVFRFIRNGLKF